MAEKLCKFSFTDRTQNTIQCAVHGEREVLKPSNRKHILAELSRAGKWNGQTLPALDESHAGESVPELAKEQLPAVMDRPTVQTDLVAYQTLEGQQVAISTEMFRKMICADANQDQARYMLGWCAHNRVDPFAHEAYFSIIQEKPIIMVSKDLWIRRMERHPRLSHYDSGLTVEIAAKRLQSTILGGMGNDYLIAPELKTLLLQAILDGKLIIPGGLEGRLVVRKRGQYLGADENLEGAWIKIWRTDRPEPMLFELNAKGWSRDNTFWKNIGPFMMWKTALKNGIRLAFPELSGLLALPEARDGLDPAALADAEFTQRCTVEQLRALHAAGAKVSPPIGPLRHKQLHDLAVLNYEDRGLVELTIFEIAQLQELIEKAVGGDKATLAAIASDLKTADSDLEDTDDGSRETIDGAIGSDTSITDGAYHPGA